MLTHYILCKYHMSNIQIKVNFKLNFIFSSVIRKAIHLNCYRDYVLSSNNEMFS